MTSAGSKELIGVDVERDRDFFGEGEPVKHFAQEAAQPNDRVTAKKDVETILAL